MEFHYGLGCAEIVLNIEIFSEFTCLLNMEPQIP